VRIERRSLYPDSGTGTAREALALKPWSRLEGDALPQEPPAVRAYMNYLYRRPDSVVGSVRAIARADGAVLVHCAAGKDRTGVVVALALDAAGVDRDTIVDDYLASAQRIDAIVARLVSSSTYRPGLEGQHPSELAPVSGTMERFFELVDERLGGSVAWLSAHGLANPDIERLQRRLTPAD
jgi:protein-tyrosine phosphatase